VVLVLSRGRFNVGEPANTVPVQIPGS